MTALSTRLSALEAKHGSAVSEPGDNRCEALIAGWLEGLPASPLTLGQEAWAAEVFRALDAFAQAREQSGDILR